MIYDNISRLCQKSGISIARLERETGLGNGVVGGWRAASPQVDNLKKVADYFGVTLDSLCRGNKEGRSNAENQAAD